MRFYIQILVLHFGLTHCITIVEWEYRTELGGWKIDISVEYMSYTIL